MNRLKLLFSTIIIAGTILPVFPQSESRDSLPDKLMYCLTRDDYFANNWTTYEGDIQLVQCMPEAKVRKNLADFEFETHNRKINKLLRKKAFAILYDGGLYVNLRFSRISPGVGWENGYSKAYPFKDGTKFFIIEKHVPLGQQMLMGLSVGLSGAVGGAIGGAVAGAMNYAINDKMVGEFTEIANKYAYIYGENRKKITWVRDPEMQQFLSASPTLQNEYASIPDKATKESAATILQYFMRLGWIHEYRQDPFFQE